MDRLSICRVLLLERKPKPGCTKPSTGPRVGQSCLKRKRPNVSIDTSNILLVVYFSSDFDSRRARLWMTKLTGWTVRKRSGDGKDVSVLQLTASP